MSSFEARLDIPIEDMSNIFGEHDAYIKKIEKDFHVTIIDRDGGLKIIGEESAVMQVKSILSNLTKLSQRGNVIEEQNVDYAITMGMEHKDDALLDIDSDCICHTVNGKPIKPKTLGQKQYVDAIRKNMIVFGLGPAGTGKTYLAMATMGCM